jgi:hypothetical protein
MCTPDRCVEGKGKDPDWMVAGIAKAKAQIALERGAVQRFQSQDDYEDQRARLESFEMSPWSPTDMEKACYEEQASGIFKLYQYHFPDDPDWDLKSHLESLRKMARGLAAGRVPDGVSKEGLEASHSQCVERDRLLQERADHDRLCEENRKGFAEWSARGELLHPDTSEAKAHGMLKDALLELKASHPLDTPEEATARFEKAKTRYYAVLAVVETLGYL